MYTQLDSRCRLQYGTWKFPTRCVTRQWQTPQNAHTHSRRDGKFPTPQRCTSHTWPNHPERVRIFYFLGEFPNRQTNNNNSIVLCPFNLVHHQLICSLWHIRINTHTPNGILWRNIKIDTRTEPMSGQFTRELCSVWVTDIDWKGLYYTGVVPPTNNSKLERQRERKELTNECALYRIAFEKSWKSDSLSLFFFFCLSFSVWLSVYPPKLATLVFKEFVFF
jgi:hypothetical protein